MKVLSLLTVLAAAVPAQAGELLKASKTISVGTRPESVTRGFGDKWYITVMNTPDKAGDGVVKVLDGDIASDFATGFNEPKGICFTGKFLVVTDVNRVWKIDAKGEKSILADDSAFSEPVVFLNDAACEPGGKAVYITDMGAHTKMRDPQGKLWPLGSPGADALPAIGRVYRVGLDGKVKIALDKTADMPCPNGVSVAGPGRLLIGEFFTGTLIEVRGKKLTPLASGMRGADAIEEDGRGNVYVSSWTDGKVFRVGKGGKEPEVVAEGFQSAADFYLDRKGQQILLPDMKAGTLTFLPLPKK
jgi:sugar lactone lactonase YvrE